jgi:ubiquinone biosynthesis accessory factor UbiK
MHYQLSELAMDRTAFLDDLQEKLSALLKNSPAADIERNVKAVVAQGLAKFELVTREEFEVQRELQTRLRARVDALEARVKALEEKSAS